VTRRALRLALVGALAASGCASNGARDAASAAAPKVTQQGVDGRVWLGPDAARASAAGAGPLFVLGADVASEGDKVGAFVEIAEGDCMVAISRSSPTVVDVDLFAFDDDGSAFAADESPDPHAAIVVCPPHPRRLYVVARVMAGSGIVSVGVQTLPRAAEAAVQRAVGARGQKGEDSGRLDGWPGLEKRIRGHRAAIGSRWDDVRRVAVPVTPRVATRVSVTVDAGRCADVLVSPSEEVGSLEVVAEDANGRIFARARDYGRDRGIVLCAKVTSTVAIAVRPRSSQGLVAVTIGRSAVGAAPEIAEGARMAHIHPMGDIDAARRTLERDLRASNYSKAKLEAKGTARLGVRTTIPIEVPAGCARIDVLAGTPLSDLAATLWDDRGQLLADTRGGGAASLFPCGKGGALRLDVEALESPGPYAIELRRDPAAPAALVALPLAAARLLGRLNAGGAVHPATVAAGAVRVTLDPGALKRVPFTVAANACVDVVVALDAGGTGLDLRLIDATTRESAVTRARYVVSDRLCAGPAARAGAIELRLGSGKADALVLQQQTPER
jgi:hypothetical protein